MLKAEFSRINKATRYENVHKFSGKIVINLLQKAYKLL